jgi:hypothetical protein
MNTHLLSKISKETISSIPFPLKEVLEGSLYYPASGVDGSPIRNWQLGVNSFVYVDMSIDECTYVGELLKKGDVRGYKVVAQRNLVADELVPNGYRPNPPASVNPVSIIEAQQGSGASITNAFAIWSILERDNSLDEQHGPKRFSLLYIRAEGAATYQALYQSNEILPKTVACIRPGVGFGGNYGEFTTVLLDTMLMHPKGLPEELLLWRGRNWGNQEAEPWSKNYVEIAGSAFAKDDEPEFGIYMYRLKNCN